MATLSTTSTSTKLEYCPTSLYASDPSPHSNDYYYDLRSHLSPTRRYNSRLSNYSLHLPQLRQFSVNRPDAVNKACEFEKERLQYINGDNHLGVSRPQNGETEGLTPGQQKRALFKVCQRAKPSKGVSRAESHEISRTIQHQSRGLKREVKSRYAEALEAELRDPNLVLSDGGEYQSSQGTVEGFSEANYGDLVDAAVEGFTKKTGKKVARDWKELSVEKETGGFWDEIGEEEWERIVLEEALLLSEKEQLETLGSDWDWALVMDKPESSMTSP